MEKLQKALSKARAERKGIAEPVSRRRTVAPQAAPAAEGIWAELTPMLPDADVLQQNHVMTLNALAEANPFDVLRTKVFLLMRQNGWKRLAVTSPNKACGKTTTACNLAVGFSRQKEVKSMLLDLDLRRPGVANVMGQRAPHDIRDMLVGEVTPQDQMLRLRDNVAFSMAQRPVDDPTQLLLAKQTVDMLDRLQAEFEPDVMIFDLPPMLLTDDARAVLKNVDCALIVARAEQTRISQLDVCEREVGEHTNVLGIVLNDCRHMGVEEYHYGNYT
jgi:Mrp family chromosome partitioning ATPase